jgi:hypothetical protein
MRAWTPEEEARMTALYGEMNANKAMTADQQNGFISRATADYFNPMSQQITQGFQNAMGQNSVNNARSGMSGSTQAIYGDQATARGASANLGNAAAQSRNMAQNDYMNYDQNRRANVSSSQSQINSLWQNRQGQGTQWTESPTGSMATGMGLAGMGIMSGSPWVQKANNWLTGGGGGEATNPNIAAGAAGAGAFTPAPQPTAYDVSRRWGGWGGNP